MFEKRPIWGLIVGLNVCVLIWLISVQEPVMLDANTAALSSSNIYTINSASDVEIGSPVAAALIGQQQQQPLSNTRIRDLLSKPIPVQINEYVDNMPVAALILNSNNSSNITSNQFDMKTTTKTNKMSSDINSLTSSMGTGKFDLRTKPTTAWDKLNVASSALPHDDFNQLIDLRNFKFLIHQPVCGNHIEALILIHSAPRNYKKRQIIRETWASISHYTAENPLCILFLLGAVTSEQDQKNLENENNIYRDIVQGSFIDDYRNMTYKHIMAFKWFLYNCPQAQILIKVDDDVYVNTPQLIKYLKEQQRVLEIGMNYTKNDNPTIATIDTTNKTSTTTTTTTTSTTTKSFSIFHKFNIFASATPSPSAASTLLAFNASQQLFNHPQDLLFCQKIIGSLVKRSYRSKWRVSFKEYSERYYPPYCPGYAIIYSPDIILRLYTAAQNFKYFWIDDVHITGVLAQQTNTTITTSSHYVLYSDECDQILTGKTDLSKTEFLFAWHSISAEKIKLLWKLQLVTLQQTLDDFHTKKATLWSDDDNYLQQQSQKELQHQFTNDIDEYFIDNEISSFDKHTSRNGFR